MKEDYVAFSIIIPVYNCEKYLEKTIQSVINQSFKNFELILVDDGSTDKSGLICDKFKNFKNIIVKHIKNNGVSNARNIGIKISKGKYICFFDSDDYIDLNYLEFANNIFMKYDIDLLNTAFYSEVEVNDKKFIDVIAFEEKLYKTKKAINKDLVKLWDKHMLYNVWNKVYVSKIIKNNKIKFPDFNFGEDMHFNMEYLKFVNSFYNSKLPFYHYIKERGESITAKYNETLFKVRIAEFYKFNEYFKSNNIKEKDYLEFSSRRFIERVVGCIENICGSQISKKEKMLKIKEITENELVKRTILISKPKSKKMKILIKIIKTKNVLLIFYAFNLLSKIRKKMPALFNKLKNRR